MAMVKPAKPHRFGTLLLRKDRLKEIADQKMAKAFAQTLRPGAKVNLAVLAIRQPEPPPRVKPPSKGKPDMRWTKPPWAQLVLARAKPGEVYTIEETLRWFPLEELGCPKRIAAGRWPFYGPKPQPVVMRLWRWKRFGWIALDKRTDRNWAWSTWALTPKGARWAAVARANWNWRLICDSVIDRDWFGKQGLTDDQALARWVERARPFKPDQAGLWWTQQSLGEPPALPGPIMPAAAQVRWE